MPINEGLYLSREAEKLKNLSDFLDQASKSVGEEYKKCEISVTSITDNMGNETFKLNIELRKNIVDKRCLGVFDPYYKPHEIIIL